MNLILERIFVIVINIVNTIFLKVINITILKRTNILSKCNYDINNKSNESTKLLILKRQHLVLSFIGLTIFFNGIILITPILLFANLDIVAFAQVDNKSKNISQVEQLKLSNLLRDSPHQGSKNASIVIIDFSDFQCPGCKRFVDNTESLINSTYVQTGEAILIFKHLPNRGFDSPSAALAAQCTNDQEKFWQYHNILFQNQGPIDSGWASAENLKKFASQITGINMTKFNSCFESKKYEELINNNVALANSMGFTETPSFIITDTNGSNMQKIEGPKPFPIFQFVIDNFVKESLK